MERENTQYRELIARRIRGLMGEERVSQVQLAEELGFSQPALSRRLLAKMPFDTDELEAIADFFNVPFTDLLPPRPSENPQNWKRIDPGEVAALPERIDGGQAVRVA